jgi:LPXTG-site transpeptidase (sortase) family protein
MSRSFRLLRTLAVSALPVLLIGGGAYVILLVTAPQVNIPIINEQPNVARHIKETENPDLDPNRPDRLYIPKINADVAIVEGNSETALEKGAWHRKPENGDPATGGNFVLAAHRFRIGWTPRQARNNSPFYHINKLEPGDEIVVDYGGKRYRYTVNKRYDAPATAVEIEARTTEHRLTLYSCDLRAKARVVVEASPVDPARPGSAEQSRSSHI